MTVYLLAAFAGYLIIAIPLWQIASEAKRMRVLMEWWWKLRPNAPVHPFEQQQRPPS